jgi:hypothetical protein
VHGKLNGKLTAANLRAGFSEFVKLSTVEFSLKRPAHRKQRAGLIKSNVIMHAHNVAIKFHSRTPKTEEKAVGT